MDTDSASIGLYAGRDASRLLYLVSTEGDGAFWFHLHPADAPSPAIDLRQLVELAILECPGECLLIQDAAPEASVESPGEVIDLGPRDRRFALYHNPHAEAQRLARRQTDLAVYSPRVTLLLQGVRFVAFLLGGFMTAAGLVASVVLLIGFAVRRMTSPESFVPAWLLMQAMLAASSIGFVLFSCGYLAGRLPWIAARERASETTDSESPDYLLIACR
jgi:hypothetical protein